MKEKEMSVAQRMLFIGLGTFIGIIGIELFKGMNAGITLSSILGFIINAAGRTACILTVFAIFHLIFKKYKAN